MWIKRRISEKITRLSEQFPALILTGARQTGKTSLLKKLFPDHHFVSLELPSQAESAEKAPQDFIQRHPQPLIIDEVQYAPGLFRYLKSWIDRNRQACGQFLLTGSQKFALMKNVSDSLAGRVAVLELETLAHSETDAVSPTDEVDFLIRGGFPELHARPDLDASAFHQSYLVTYLERDVRSLMQVGQLRDFERFIRACALRSGQILNKADLARDVGISPTTANQWISVLEASNQITLLEPWYRNKTKSMVKSPKLYLSDTGMLCHLLGISTREEFLKSPLAGAVWETFAFSEIRKSQIFRAGKWELYFWRDLRGLEADFLVHQGGNFEIMEAKFSETPDARDAAKLEQVAQQLGPKAVLRKRIVSRAPVPFPVDAGVEAVSVRELA